LNEIITSAAKIVHSNGSSECPWMTDGAGLPSNASELLPKLVNILASDMMSLMSIHTGSHFCGYL